MLALVALAVGCGGHPTPPAAPAPSGCERSSLEPDLKIMTAWTGPGVVAGAVTPGRYVIATTRLQLRTTDDSRRQFLRVMSGIAGTIDHAPGLVAYQIASSERCAVTRTLTVWRDEVTMDAFVLGHAHAEAISVVGQVSRGGSNTAHWEDTEQGATWDKAQRQIAGGTGPFY